jgi:hypothetical protein
MKNIVSYIRTVRHTARSPEYRGSFHQLLEMFVVFFVCGVGPGYYLMAQMGNKQYRWKYKLGFLNGRQYVRRINKINDLQYYLATFNKAIEKSLLAQNSIQTPAMLGVFSAIRGRACAGFPLKTSEDLARLVEISNARKICFKLISGQGGAGFRATEIVAGENGKQLRDMRDQRVYSLEEYCAVLGIQSGGEFIIEEYFEQHPVLGALNPSSVNTLRVMVYRAEKAKTRCLGVYLRIGRSGAVVDNGSAGGISAKIGIDRGTLCAATYVTNREHQLIRHPDSDVLIQGVKIPFLDEAIALAIDALDVFPGMNYGVFDVAIGIDGPIIIELNARADYVDFSILNIPSRLALC